MADEQTTDTTAVETTSLMDAPPIAEGEKTEEVTTSEEEKTAVSEGEKNAQAFADAVVSARAEWRNAAIADPEFGGKDLSANMPIAVGARDKFGTPELKTLLDESGLGEHPEVIRFFYRVGKATGEHDFVKSGSGVTAPVSFYDHPTSKAK